MNKLIIVLLLFSSNLLIFAQTTEKSIYIFFENNQNGMRKFTLDSSDSLYFFSYSSNLELFGLLFSPISQSKTISSFDFAKEKHEIHNYKWAIENLHVGNKMFWEEHKYFIVEITHNDSLKITACTRSVLEE